MEDLGTDRMTNMKQLEKSTKMINKPNIMSPKLKNRGSNQMNSSMSSATNPKFLMISPSNSMKSSHVNLFLHRVNGETMSNIKATADVKLAYQLEKSNAMMTADKDT